VVDDVSHVATDPSFLQALDINSAIADWQKVGQDAQNFVQNAHIQVTNAPAGS